MKVDEDPQQDAGDRTWDLRGIPAEQARVIAKADEIREDLGYGWLAAGVIRH